MKVPTYIEEEIKVYYAIQAWRQIFAEHGIRLLNSLPQRGYSLYIEEHTLRTTKVLRQIGCSARHFRRNVASPAPSPDRDKTIEFRSIDQVLFFKN